MKITITIEDKQLSDGVSIKINPPLEVLATMTSTPAVEYTMALAGLALRIDKKINEPKLP